MLKTLDWILFFAHAAWIGFALVGWIWPRTRTAHLIVTGATILSWFGLGLFYGFGYCPLTDWHWHVKRELGERDLPGSWAKYYADKLTGMDWSPAGVDAIVLALGVSAFCMAMFLRFRRARRRKADPAQFP